jgi:MtrB/PioB family decaheme-associated outer membrane protein
MRCRALLLFSATVSPAALAQDFELGAVPVKRPPPAFASMVEIGSGFLSDRSSYRGRYGGRRREGLFVFTEGSVIGRQAWDADSTRFWRGRFGFDGQDRGYAQAEVGDQGRWRLGVQFDSFTRFYNESSRTPFTGVGTTRLSLPATWLGTASSFLFPNLIGQLQPLDLKIRWQSIGGDFVLQPRTGYEVRLHFDHRRRDGLREQYISFGHEMLFPVGVFFPQPVNYDSSHLTASLAFADRRLQWTASYSLRTFRNAQQAVLVPNPYARSLGTPWPAGAFAGYPFAVGQFSLPPENTAHQFAVNAGFTPSPQMRITAKLSYGVQTQNDPFLPYTTNPALSVPMPLPRTSADARVNKTYGNLTVAMRPSPAWELNAAYTFDNRDNDTPRALYSYVANDVIDQPQPAVFGVSRYIRYNLPHSFTFHQAKGEVAYRLAARTRLSVTYTGDFRHRTYQAVTSSREHTVRAKVQTTFGQGSAWIAGTRADRTGRNYDDALAWNESHTDTYLAASPNNQSIEYPLLRKFHLADRRRHEVRGGGTLEVIPALAVTAGGAYAEDDYRNSPFGLRRADTLSADAEVSYTVEERLTGSLFYTFERIRSDQKGYFLFNTNENNPAQEWTAQNRDRVHTAGARVDWKALPDRLTLSANYLVSAGTTRVTVQATPFTPLAVVRPLPDIRITTHTIGTAAELTVASEISFRLNYAFERHSTEDWRYLNSLTPAAQILGSGELAPRYTAHLTWLSARYRF